MPDWSIIASLATAAGQRVISRFILTAHDDRWLASVGKYCNLDRPEPR